MVEEKLIVNKKSGLLLSYSRVNSWNMAVPIDESMCDGTVYRKDKQGSFWKLNFPDGKVNVKMFGAIGDSSACSDQIQAAIDFAEANFYQTVYIPAGFYYLDKPLKIRMGNIKIEGDGTLNRDGSEKSKEYAKKYPEVEALFKGHVDSVNFNRNIITMLVVPEGGTGIIVEESVVDPIRFSNFGMYSPLTWAGDNTTAILFKSMYYGPVWPLIVEDCYFQKFNFVFKIASPNLRYSLAFALFERNSFMMNEEVVYCDYVLEDTVAPYSKFGQRNTICGFVFRNNKCHQNTRLIKGSFLVQRVVIEDNNLEGQLNYFDGTNAESYIDIEVMRCTVRLAGNYSEFSNKKIFKASSFLTNSTGAIVDKKFQEFSGAMSNHVILEGNTFIATRGFRAVSIIGCKVTNFDSGFDIEIDSCIVETINSSSFEYFARFPEGSNKIVKNNFKQMEDVFKTNNNEIYYSRNITNTSASNILFQTPFGVRQMSFIERGAVFSGEIEIKDVMYLGATFFVFNAMTRSYNFSEWEEPHKEDFIQNKKVEIGCFISYTHNGQNFNLQIENSDIEMKSIARGFSLLNSVVNISGIIPEEAIEKKFKVTVTGDISDGDVVLVGNNFTMYAINNITNRVRAIPYYDFSNNQCTKEGTFEKGQTFVSTEGVYHIVRESGTAGNISINVPAGIAQGDRIIESNLKFPLIIGSFLNINGTRVKVINVKGNYIYIDSPAPSSVSPGANLNYFPPTFVVVGEMAGVVPNTAVDTDSATILTELRALKTSLQEANILKNE